MHNIYLVSLGCDKNRVDGETMVGTLRQGGYQVVNNPEMADAIIVNTCGFIKEAVQESIDLILELSEYKTQGSCRGLLVVGCMAQRYKKEILEAIPEADLIIGVGEYEGIADAVASLIGKAESTASTGTFARLAARVDDATPHIAYIKIAEGCDNHCTYCTIPSIRGPYKSRPMEDILEEARQLVDTGVAEIILVAQDTALYGTDIYKENRLPQLLESLATLDVWIRLMYAYPEHITDALISTMAKLPQVCKYIDMPIQHSETVIINRMGRRGSKQALKDIISKLRTAMPNIAIRTTLIVGFPSECGDAFNRMHKFVADMQFDRLGAFPYSQEAGTPAATMAKQVRESTKLTRLERIMDLQQSIHFAKQASKIGMVEDVIIDSIEDDGSYTGRTQYDAYEVDATVNFTANQPLTKGKIYPVKITAANGYDLGGIYEPAQ